MHTAGPMSFARIYQKQARIGYHAALLFISLLLCCGVDVYTGYQANNNNNNNNSSQCGSYLRSVWKNPDVSSLTSTDITARREADSTRPTKQEFCESICKHL